MSGFSFKSALVAIVLLGSASTASATDIFAEALALTEGHARIINQTRYVKLSDGINIADAKVIDAAITSKFGTPSITRSGLKVWEVKNDNGSADTADQVTITCGMEDGRIQISIDARLPDDAPRLAQKSLKPVPVTSQIKASKAKEKTKPVPKSTGNKPQSRRRLTLRPQNSDR